MMLGSLYIGCASRKGASKEPTAGAEAISGNQKTQAKTTEPSVKPGEKEGEFQVHVVQKGETLSFIAARYKVTVEAIVKLNNIQDPNFIMIGQKILIPKPKDN